MELGIEDPVFAHSGILSKILLKNFAKNYQDLIPNCFCLNRYYLIQLWIWLHPNFKIEKNLMLQFEYFFLSKPACVYVCTWVCISTFACGSLSLSLSLYIYIYIYIYLMDIKSADVWSQLEASCESSHTKKLW